MSLCPSAQLHSSEMKPCTEVANTKNFPHIHEYFAHVGPGYPKTKLKLRRANPEEGSSLSTGKRSFFFNVQNEATALGTSKRKVFFAVRNHRSGKTRSQEVIT